MFDIVIVTYGDRWGFLSRVVQLLSSIKSINTIVVVNNNVPYNLNQRLKEINADKFHEIRFESNMGSAKGFSIGIQYLKKSGESDYIYLLDDDNLPSENTFDILQNIVAKKERNAYATLRLNRDYLVKSKAGFPTQLLFPVYNSFFGFDIITFLKRQFYKIGSKKNNKNHKESIVIPMAPYGGFFFHKDMIDEVGLPDERMFLYADDFEFTYRFTVSGKKIILLTDCYIKDLERAWVEQKTHSPIIRLIYLNNYKAYFSARNTAYFSSEILKRNALVYFINKWIVILHALLHSLFSGKWNTFKYLYALIKQGEKGIFNNEEILLKKV